MITIVEVGPRDGLQNEPAKLPTDVKVALIDRLGAAGLKVIEIGSFVSARRVPQMADTEEVVRALRRVPGVRYPVLVPNVEGMMVAIRSGVEDIAIFAAASETFSSRNISCSIAESIDRFRPVVELARVHGVRVRGYVSCVLGCPYEGEIAPAAVASVSRHLKELGCYEVSLGDTIGVGTPRKAVMVVEAVAAEIGISAVAVHFHDTRGQALANILACLELGVRVIDSSVAGLGGCPFAANATGNVATEDVVYMLEGMGLSTGVSLELLIDAGEFISAHLRKRTASKVGQAHMASRETQAALS